MTEISTFEKLTEINWVYVIGALLLLAIFVVAFFKIADALADLAKRKFGITIKSTKSEDHEMLLEIKNTVCKLAEKQNKDTEDSILKDKELKAEIVKLTSNVANLDAKVDQIIMKNKLRDEAQMEEMCNLIETKTRHYINDLEGIPEDEYDSFVRLFNAYRGINGNHGAEAKFNYCIKNLPIISVKTELKN